MGFPGSNADWSTVEGAMYMGAGGSMPGMWTALAVIACIVVLAMGHMSESAKYKKVG